MNTSRPYSLHAAFTLVEMLVVIAIIAILAAALVPAVRNMGDTADATKCTAHLRNLHQATLNYLSENGSYPFAGPYEVYSTLEDTFSQRRGWVTWTPNNSSQLESDAEFEKYYRSKEYNGVSVSQSQAEKLRHPVWGLHGDMCKHPDDPTREASHARIAVEIGSIFKYNRRDFSSYCCPRFAKRVPPATKPVRSYVMNSYFGSRRNRRWHAVRPVDMVNDKKEASRMLLFTEMGFANVPTYKATEDSNKGEPAGKEKTGTAFRADGVFDFSASSGAEVFGAIHRKAGKMWGHAIFVDGHVEALEGDKASELSEKAGKGEM